jgi:eukaryotic-like serine/threonine-protein kinase
VGRSGKLTGALVVGRYDVREILGAGGKGTVYEARDRTLGRDVALKVPSSTSEDAIKRFLREGRAGASVAHPNVCAILDFGPLDDGTPFLVMERLSGEPLSELFLRAPRMAPKTAIPIVQQVLAGLAAAHQQGIVHRDIKPANIFLSGSEDPPVAKILDFGASTLLRNAPSRPEDFEALTKVGTAIGTPIYMCSEQVRGERDLDGRVDVYACGVILYEALTGVPPFNAPRRTELFRLILGGKFTRASDIERRVTLDLDAVIAQALAVDRRNRYADPGTFAAALESLRLDGLESVTMPHSTSHAESIRLAALQQRLEEVSSFYVESASTVRAAKAVTTADIPVHFEEDPPPDSHPGEKTRPGRS